MPAKSKHPLWNTWKAMLARCDNSSDPAWKWYGKRGISVCNQWRDFDVFVSDMGTKPTPLHTLDRIDGEGNYEPTNCRWATRAEQMRNVRNLRYVVVGGMKYAACELAEKSGLKTDTIVKRAKNVATLEELVSPERRPCLEGLSLGGKANGARQRAKTHCKHGHEFTPENTMRNGAGRACRKCHALRESLRRAKSKRQTFGKQDSTNDY